MTHPTKVLLHLDPCPPPSPTHGDFAGNVLPWRTPPNRTRVTNLHLLLEMPLDILYEIFGHLHPLDLLHLARTSKLLRSMLMVPSAASVWRSSFHGVQGLPPCPWDLEEPQYANLVFDEHCHFCLAPKAQNLFWSCRVRCCKRCLQENFVSEFTLEHNFPKVGEICQLKSLFPYIVYPKPSHQKPGQTLYYVPYAEKLIREHEQLSRRSDADSLQQWHLQKSMDQAQRIHHARMCEIWSLRWAFQPSQEHNTAIIMVLTAFLAILWRDAILQTFSGLPLPA